MSFPSLSHNHTECIAAALDTAERECQRRGARLTALRRQVLALVWDSHRPIGAYALLDRLGQSGRAAAPPTVYRALDFLLDQGLIHRVPSRNGYIGCTRPDQPHSGRILLCQGCGQASELDSPALDQAIATASAAQGFLPHHHILEIEGLCPACRAAEPCPPGIRPTEPSE